MNKQSGFFDLPNSATCRNSSHNPPTGLYIPEGKGYRHVCPACGAETILANPAYLYDMRRKFEAWCHKHGYPPELMVDDFEQWKIAYDAGRRKGIEESAVVAEEWDHYAAVAIRALVGKEKNDASN